jgi:hypothetical protein
MLLPFSDGLIKTNHYDSEMAALADRHYSRQKHGAAQFSPNGKKLVLRNNEGTVLFVWMYPQFRLDRQTGYNCTLFRNESNRLSSEIILEAERIVFDYWGADRLYTFIDRRKIKSPNPGYCFKMAGWTFQGFSRKRRKVILAKALKAEEAHVTSNHDPYRSCRDAQDSP